MKDKERMITSRNIEQILSSAILGVQIELDHEYIHRHFTIRQLKNLLQSIRLLSSEHRCANQIGI